jgi:GntR family transcriptional regulator, transcriptional repressor for pyruvate dehydrogenase complex
MIIPVQKQRLSDNLAQTISNYIASKQYAAGEKLPTIAELSRQFGVGSPTLREAIKKLETMGIVTVKHGSGIYVGENTGMMFLSNPITAAEKPTKKILLDLIDARIPIEMQTVGLAAENITAGNIAHMEELLEEARNNLDNDELLGHVNMAFHLEIAAASGNKVLHQLIGVFISMYRKEQQFLLHVYRSKEKDLQQHMGILNALRKRNKSLAVERMKQHLFGVRKSILIWSPEENNY